jgi:4-hydroxy-4-methyl-2-oxoglutarate aldolase
MSRPSTPIFTLDGFLTPGEIEALRNISSPTIANAIETFDVRPRGEGFTGMGVQCFFPEKGTMLGYACTAIIHSGQPAAPSRLVSRTKYWEYVKQAPQPKVSVVQDLSHVPLGAYFGEVNSNIHLALGSEGVITNGAVRDIEEVRGTNFKVFASGASVSHGFAHLEDFNRSVKIFGMTVLPGDLIHADQHGAVVIPRSIAGELAAAARAIENDEREMIRLCKSDEFSIPALDKLISPDY